MQTHGLLLWLSKNNYTVERNVAWEGNKFVNDPKDDLEESSHFSDEDEKLRNDF